MDTLLQQGITAYKAGKRAEARNMFIAYVKQNPQSELAWGWMYQISDTDKERIYCLKQMLRINPENEKTGQLLNQLIAAPPPSFSVASLPSQDISPEFAAGKCPRCQEEIPTGATRCKYCGRDRDEGEPAKKNLDRTAQTSDTGNERIPYQQQIVQGDPGNEKTDPLADQLIMPPSAPLPPIPTPDTTPNIATSKCPRCKETIQTGAQRCKYCGWDRTKEKMAQEQKKTKKRSSIISLIVIIIMILVCVILYGLISGVGVKIAPTAIPTKTTEENAWYACTLFIEKQLKVSIIDSQKFNSNGVVLLDNGQYRVDVEYAKLMTIYTCTVLDRTGGSWELIKLVATRK